MRKRKPLLFLILFLFSMPAIGQALQTDSLKAVLQTAKDDTLKVEALLSLSRSLYISEPEEALRYANKALQLSVELKYQKGLAYAYKSLGLSSYFEGKYIETINYWQESLNIFESIGDKVGVSNLLSNLGAVNSNEGDDTKALELYLESLKVAEEINDSLRIATALINIGLVYLKKKNTHDLALDYYLRAIPISENIGDNDAIGTACMNIGEIYFERGDYTTALSYFERSLDALKQSGNIFYPLNNIGKVYAKRGDFKKAIEFQTDAYEKAKKVDAKLDMSRTMLGLADTYILQKKFKAAINSFNQAKSLAEEVGSNYELRDSYQGLARSFAELADYKNAYIYQSLLTEIKDTLFNTANEKKLELIQLNYDIDKKQGEIDLLTADKALQEARMEKQRLAKNAILAGLIFILIIAFITFRNYLAKVKVNKILDKQKEEIENLLLNILPRKIAKELRLNGAATPRNYESVSVLFTDFKDFTKISTKLTSDELVQELNDYFVAFDSIVEKYNLEKIKTIGDSYMCAGGLPSKNETHPLDTINAALEMQKYMIQKNKLNEAKGKDTWGLRIGIHSGPILAGVVGKKKYAYDIWGSTVNVASRMETAGEVGKVNISEATFNLVKDKFQCHHRGKVSAKNVGEIDMYFVENGIETH